MKGHDEIRLCCNCKHYHVLITEEPCLTCGLVVDERNNWEPKEVKTMDEIKLKPCPFCGGEPYFYTKSIGEENGALSFYFRIACRRCQTSPNNAYGDIKIHLLDFEVDEMLLKDPQLRFVGNCEGCAKVEDENGEPCKVLLSFENIVKSNYCSEFKRKVSDGSNIQTTTRPPIPRTTKRYEGTLGRIERERGASVGDSDLNNATPDERRGNTGDDD